MKYCPSRIFEFVLVTFILVIFLSVTGCAGGTEVGNPVPQTPTLEGLGEPTEFELMALCVSGQATPPKELTNLFEADITNIRSQSYEEVSGFDATPDTGITFTPPWAPGKISIRFDDKTAGLVASGQYKEWDNLNSMFYIKDINLDLIDYGLAFLEFYKKSIHPKYIAEQYETLQGIDYAEPDYIIGDYSNIYPYIPAYEITMSEETLNNNIRYYLFRKGYGDCPSGCIDSEYWLFSADKDGITYIGYYNTDEYEFPDKPDWWNIAQKAIDLYRAY
jgi:hypothetical protein